MLRNLNVSSGGKREASGPRVGVLASEIPAGKPREAFLLNDVDPAFPNRLYSLEILTLPSAGTLTLNRSGVGSFSGAPAAAYTGTQRVEKYDPGVGRISSVTGEYVLEVKQPLPIVESVVVSPAVASGSQQFAVVVNGQNSPSQIVTWSKEGLSNADGTVDAAGYYTAPPPATAARVVTIRATSRDDPNVFGTATITIPAIIVSPVARVSVTPSAAVIEAGATRQYAALVEGPNSPLQDVTWSVDLGEIDASGKVTVPLITGAPQIGTVTATSDLDPAKIGRATFTIMPSEILAEPVRRFARPIRDISRNGWVPSKGNDLFSMVDDIVAGDDEFISATTSAVCELALRPVIDPNTSSNQAVRYRAYSPTGAGLTVELRQGALLIASWTHDALPTTTTLFEQALTGAQCDSITNYADLRIKFVAA